MAAETSSAHALRRAWLTELARRTARDVSSWRTPAVDAVVAACAARTPEGVDRALRALAAERAAADGALDDLLTEVEALWSVPDPCRRPFGTAQARAVVVDAWVEVAATDRGVPAVDRLTGLHTRGYLTGRIVELDRIAGNDDAPHLVLLVVRWRPPPGAWLRAAVRNQVADALRDAVRPAATLCVIGGGTAAALVPDDGDARAERKRLARVLQSEPASSAGVTTTLVPVPDRRNDLERLLDSLLEPPAEQVVAPSSQVRMRAAE